MIATCCVEKNRPRVFALQLCHHGDKGDVQKDPNLQRQGQVIHSCKHSPLVNMEMKSSMREGVKKSW